MPKCLALHLDDHLDCHCFCTIRLVRTCHPHCCSLMLVTLVQALSDVLDDFFLRLSLWPCPGCADSRCASCAPPDRPLLDHLVPLRVSRSSVLSVASCNVTSFTVSCVRILLRSHGWSILPKGTTPEIVYSGSLQSVSRRPWPA